MSSSSSKFKNFPEVDKFIQKLISVPSDQDVYELLELEKLKTRIIIKAHNTQAEKLEATLGNLLTRNISSYARNKRKESEQFVIYATDVFYVYRYHTPSVKLVLIGLNIETISSS